MNYDNYSKEWNNYLQKLKAKLENEKLRQNENITKKSIDTLEEIDHNTTRKLLSVTNKRRTIKNTFTDDKKQKIENPENKNIHRRKSQRNKRLLTYRPRTARRKTTLAMKNKKSNVDDKMEQGNEHVNFAVNNNFLEKEEKFDKTAKRKLSEVILKRNSKLSNDSNNSKNIKMSSMGDEYEILEFDETIDLDENIKGKNVTKIPKKETDILKENNKEIESKDIVKGDPINTEFLKAFNNFFSNVFNDTKKEDLVNNESPSIIKTELLPIDDMEMLTEIDIDSKNTEMNLNNKITMTEESKVIKDSLLNKRKDEVKINNNKLITIPGSNNEIITRRKNIPNKNPLLQKISDEKTRMLEKYIKDVAKNAEEENPFRSSSSPFSKSSNVYKTVMKPPVEILRSEDGLYKYAVNSRIKEAIFKTPDTKFNPNNYTPKTQIPEISSDNEQTAEGFTPPDWALDPRLVQISRDQKNEELISYFGGVVEVDLVKMFPNIKNVTNDSPNKWTGR